MHEAASWGTSTLRLELVARTKQGDANTEQAPQRAGHSACEIAITPYL